ncbi:MAG: type II toxin-antitoxin system PemK/MazF family toxin [bacterium]|nr:type II toxin-antitoxin system PemK/MazF family toxin [bacterium]
MRRGELYWARLDPRSGSEQQGRRPVVVVSSDGFNEVPAWRTIIVVPVSTSTRQARRAPTTVPLTTANTGLPRASFAICHQITTLDRSKVEARIGALSWEAMLSIEEGIAAACDLKP